MHMTTLKNSELVSDIRIRFHINASPKPLTINLQQKQRKTNKLKYFFFFFKKKGGTDLCESKPAVITSSPNIKAKCENALIHLIQV